MRKTTDVGLRLRFLGIPRNFPIRWVSFFFQKGGLIQFETIKIPKMTPPPPLDKNWEIFIILFFWSIFDISIENSMILLGDAAKILTGEKSPNLGQITHFLA